jgi:hypothetical protein
MASRASQALENQAGRCTIPRARSTVFTAPTSWWKMVSPR